MEFSAFASRPPTTGVAPCLSGNLALGGTISPRFLLGVGTTGWTKEVEGIRVNFGLDVSFH